MRPIDGDSLKEEISNLTITITGIRAGKGVLGEFMREYRKTILRTIDEQPTIEPYGTWIPCRERLPEYGRCFKVWASFSNQYASYTKRIHWDYDRFVWNNGREVKEMPDAWMPYFSPLPYREEKKDE